MGKRIIQQKRGKGSPTYRNDNFRSPGSVRLDKNKGHAEIVDIMHSNAHTAPLFVIAYEDGSFGLTVAGEGLRVGDILEIGDEADFKIGSAMKLKDIPEGTPVYNVELVPGDGGKFVRSSGAAARVVGKSTTKVTLKLPSKKTKEFNPNCIATIGLVAGSGRVDKPFLKAGNKFKAVKNTGKYWPVVSGASMNAVDHPFGCKRSSRKGRPTIAPKNAPPGRKVGMVRPRHTGRNK